jgi:hypothetical protein
VNDADRPEGERRKRAALDRHAARHGRLVRAGQRALLARLLAVGTATADAVRDSVCLPPGVSPRAFGAVPGPLARAGLIAAVGFARTARPTAHARPVTVWRLADRAGALAWLRDHPAADPPPDAPPPGCLF